MGVCSDLSTGTHGTVEPLRLCASCFLLAVVEEGLACDAAAQTPAALQITAAAPVSTARTGRQAGFLRAPRLNCRLTGSGKVQMWLGFRVLWMCLVFRVNKLCPACLQNEGLVGVLHPEIWSLLFSPSHFVALWHIFVIVGLQERLQTLPHLVLLAVCQACAHPAVQGGARVAWVMLMPAAGSVRPEHTLQAWRCTHGVVEIGSCCWKRFCWAIKVKL